MSTEQSYVGKGDSATPPPQVDATASKTPPTSDDWREDFLLHVGSTNGRKEYLFSLLDIIRNQVETTNPIPILIELLNNWVNNPYVRLGAEENRRKVERINNLIIFFVKLQAHYECFDIESDYSQCADEEEVSHE